MADMSEAWGVVFYSFWMAVSSVLKRRALTTAHPVEACATVDRFCATRYEGYSCLLTTTGTGHLIIHSLASF